MIPDLWDMPPGYLETWIEAPFCNAATVQGKDGVGVTLYNDRSYTFDPEHPADPNHPDYLGWAKVYAVVDPELADLPAVARAAQRLLAERGHARHYMQCETERPMQVEDETGTRDMRRGDRAAIRGRAGTVELAEPVRGQAGRWRYRVLLDRQEPGVLRPEEGEGR